MVEPKESDKIGAVMVIGAGIAGIQTSLDLANSGFKVYLVDKKPCIGGVMPQLDKTFPTNDCAMCILAPKLVDTGRHQNIEIITMAQVKSVEGEPGNFKVDVLKKARSVDEEKCTGCGVCTENCLVRNRPYIDVIEEPRIEIEEDKKSKVEQIVQSYGAKQGSLVPVLQDVNTEFNWLPQGALMMVAKLMGIPLGDVLRVTTFYTMFNLTPKGKYIIHVCLGTACYIKGGKRILDTFEKQLGIKVGETTDDLKYSLEIVNCLGCCGQSPVVKVNEDIYGYMRQTRVPEILKRYE